MIRNIFIITLILFTYSTPSKFNETQETNAPIVVELFTSKLCPSCPPADRKLHELSQQDNIIALGCHISYFNKGYKKDDLSKEFCDIRQHGYVGLTESRRIYTPQMIVNGEYIFIGTENDALELALQNAKNNPIKTIQIEVKNNIMVNFSLPNIENGSYRLWAFGYNTSGKSITYANAAISYTNLGAWQGNTVSKSFLKPDDPIEGIIFLAQENGYEKIVAAGKLEF